MAFVEIIAQFSICPKSFKDIFIFEFSYHHNCAVVYFFFF